MATTIAQMTISFGLVSIPVTVAAATESRSVGLHQVHARDGARVRQRRICEAEGVEVPWDEVARGYAAPDGRVVVLTDEDLADLPLPTAAKTIEVLGFVPSESVDPLLLDRPYYLGAATIAAARPYVLLREVLTESGLVGVARWALRTRESLVLLRVRGHVLVAHTLLWPEEVREPAGLAPPELQPSEREMDMARLLLEQLADTFNWDDQHDEYRHALEQVVQAKLAETEPPHAPGARVIPTEVVDLMAALEASVESARAGRSSGREEPTRDGD